MLKLFNLQTRREANAHLAEQGFVIYQGLDFSAIKKLTANLEQQLRQELNEHVTLENYHLHVPDDKIHKALQFKMFNILGQSKTHIKLVEHNREVFEGIYGLDIDIQVSPYLRVARPGKICDNIGLHRDTFYGNSAFEVSNSVNLTEVNEKGALNIVAGSHRLGEIATRQTVSEDVVKGSDANKMGFLYAPKVVQKADEYQLTPVPLQAGQILMFSLGVLHGQEVNNDDKTRWSVDFRLKATYSPVSKHLKPGYYQPLFQSGVVAAANTYYETMPDEQAALLHSKD